MINYFIKTFASFFCAGLLLSTGPAVFGQATETPWRAVVIGEDAVVRSGPGKSHYGTDRLKPGTEVQVFRSDPGGWMAIRPPSRSFSLVQKSEVEIDENGLATVIEKDTVAWVGTRLNAVKKPLWQIRLRKGEMLKVLGTVDRQQYQLENDDPDWVQIEPPPGEFRWIASTNINAISSTESTESKPAEISAQANTDARSGSTERQLSSPVPFDTWEPTQVPGEWTLEVETGDLPDLDGFDSSSSSPPTSGWKPARQTIANFVSDRSQFIADRNDHPVLADVSNSTQNQSGQNVRSDVFDSLGAQGNYPVSQVSTQATALLAPTFGNPAIQALEMNLTQEMLKQPAQWDLMTLAGQLEQARTTATSQQDIDSLNRIGEKIRSCREIKAGFRATRDPPGYQNLQTRRKTGPGPNHGPTSLLYNYDAYGILNELVRDGGTGPTAFVLQDETGRITHHIAAPPGVNLRLYLNQRVGIIGSRGYHQQLQLEHVTAERVIAIDSVRR